MFSKEGKCIKFESSTVPLTGRVSQGVIGMKGEIVYGTTSNGIVEILSKNNKSVHVNIEELNVQGRAGKGVFFKKMDSKTGEWVNGSEVKSNVD